MESKVLNLPDALDLASIVSKYIVTEEIGEMTPYEFISDLFSKLTEREILIISVMAKMNISIDPDEFLLGMGEFLLNNEIMKLLEAYKALGFE